VPGTPATLGPTLTTIEALTGIADRMIYFTGTDIAALATITAAARTLVAAIDATAQRAALGLGTAATQTYTDATTFTATATGFSTAVTGTARYAVMGKMVILHLPDLNGTSNAATFTITGLPAGIAASGTVRVAALAQDNSAAYQWGLISLSGTAITVYPNTGLGAWTASGGKAIFPPTIAYLLT
jgi:hypothetical protein